ncbi:hypothetical protein CRG98_011374 [Punica granatum]|uniref:Uncharacterized protein n=1 Tax=Punica granatum TaxID=22663 RepID=A0A2I0KIB8_PUNGR|nr:hypothetical protein CRG98_011374 [Punica granatum]
MGKGRTMKEQEVSVILMHQRRGANWPGRRRASMGRNMHSTAKGLKYNSILENGILSPSSTTLRVRVTVAMESIGSKRGPGGDVYPKVKGLKVARRPTRQTVVGIGLEICMGLLHDEWFSATRTVLPMDGGPRLKGINSLKSSMILFKAEAAVKLRAIPPLRTPI